jgi:hypothetical protein
VDLVDFPRALLVGRLAFLGVTGTMIVEMVISQEKREFIERRHRDDQRRES